MSYAYLGQTPSRTYVPLAPPPLPPATIAALAPSRLAPATSIPAGYMALPIGGSASFAQPLREFQDALVEIGLLQAGSFRPRFLNLTVADPTGAEDPTYLATVRAAEAAGVTALPVIFQLSRTQAPGIAIEQGLYDGIVARAEQHRREFWSLGPVRMHWTHWLAAASGIAVIGGGAYALGRRH